MPPIPSPPVPAAPPTGGPQPRAEWPPVLVENLDLVRGDGFVDIRCDVTLRESWRFPAEAPPGNWNAAWLFVKYRSTVVERSLSPDQLRSLLVEARNVGPEEAERVLQQARARLGSAFDFEAPAGGVAAAVEAIAVRFEEKATSLGAGGQSEPTAGVLHVAPGDLTDDGEQTFEARATSHWQTARLSSRAADHRAPPTAELTAVPDGMGVFLFRGPAALGEGPITFEGVRLRWVGTGALEFPVELWVHGLEMVHVPEGPYELGDPAGPTGDPKCFFDRDAVPNADGETNWAFRVTSEGELPVARYDGPAEAAGGAHRLTWRVPDTDRDAAGASGRNSWGPIPASFPKGYGGFYCMRRQVTQGDYCEFVNSLKGDQITARFPYGGQGEYRFTIFKLANGERAVTRPMRACNWLSWVDGAAFLWWAGLRPLTELEYEKACRGSEPAVSGEFAWGTTKAVPAYVIIGDEAGRSFVTGNCHLDSPMVELQGGDGGQGPVRDDAFSPRGDEGKELVQRPNRAKFYLGAGPGGEQVFRQWSAFRPTSGASYWNIYGLSGNLWEYVISASVAAGRAFDGQHGAGELNRVGMPPLKESSWPDASGLGVGYRGGSWYTVAAAGHVSHRGFAAGFEDYVFRSHDTGIRGARSAPQR